MAKDLKSKKSDEKEAVAEIMAEVAVESKPVKKAKESLDDDVFIEIPVAIKLKRKELLPGRHKVKRHQVDTIREMVDKKVKADLSIFTGKSYLLDRLANNTLVVKEVDKL